LKASRPPGTSVESPFSPDSPSQSARRRQPPRVLVAIPTRERPDSLSECLESLRRQTLSLSRVIVCDSSVGQESRQVCERFGDLGIEYVRSREAGLTLQRNLCLDRLREDDDAILFLDDDVVLREEYVDVLAEYLFSADAGGMHAGVAGVTEGYCMSRPRSRKLRIYLRLFGLRPASASGCVLASGVNVPPPSEGPPVRVDWLFGCAMYPAAIAQHLRFSSELPGGALYEDVDYSMIAARHGELVVVPAARLEHRQSPVLREDRSMLMMREVVHRHWLVSRHRDAGLSMLAFWWSVLGLALLVYRGAKLGGDAERAEWAGVRMGIRALLAGARPVDLPRADIGTREGA
jgi:glycosyltransferase involved in cell wall biosynthesis